MKTIGFPDFSETEETKVSQSNGFPVCCSKNSVCLSQFKKGSLRSLFCNDFLKQPIAS